MIFSSYIFIFAFLPVMLVGFYGLRYFNLHRGANVFLVLGSLFFYGFWNVLYLPLLVGSMGVNFLLAKAMLKVSGGGGLNIT